MIVHDPEFDFMHQVFLEGKIAVEVREWCGIAGDWHHSVFILFENGNSLTDPFANGSEACKYITIAKMLRMDVPDRKAPWQFIKPRLFGNERAIFVSTVSTKRQLHNQGRPA